MHRLTFKKQFPRKSPITHIPSIQKSSKSLSPLKKSNIGSLTDDFYSNLLDWNTDSKVLIGANNKLKLLSFYTDEITTIKTTKETITSVKNFINDDNDVILNGYSNNYAINRNNFTKKCNNVNSDYIGSYSDDMDSDLCLSDTSTLLDLNPSDNSLKSHIFGTISGSLYYIDAITHKTTKLLNHSSRIGVLEQINQNLFLSGSRDRIVRLNDIRCKNVINITCHDQEICGIKVKGNWIATGGNDNKVQVIDIRRLGGEDSNNKKTKNTNTTKNTGTVINSGLNNLLNNNSTTDFSNYNLLKPEIIGYNSFLAQYNPYIEDHTFSNYLNKSKSLSLPLLSEFHKAAVKALSWSDHNILASGGGTADKKIKLWSMQSLDMISSKNMESQVCNLRFLSSNMTGNSSCGFNNGGTNLWNNYDEVLVSTHGYSHNDARISNFYLDASAHFYGHMNRIVHMGIDKSGNYMITGSGDDYVMIWGVGSKYRDAI